MSAHRDFKAGWRVLRRTAGAAGLVGCFALAGTGASLADSLTAAMVSAYENNPTLNAARAALRATDENLAQAKGGYRPRVVASGDYGVATSSVDPVGGDRFHTGSNPAGVSITVTQDLFRGFRTRNAIKGAKSAIFAGREGLINEEQNTLLSAVEAYMNVVRDSAVVNLNVQNLSVLREQLRSVQDRFDVGEVTRTDVAQSEAGVQQAISQLLEAESNLAASQASYRQVVGRNPNRLSYPKSFPLPLPKNLKTALASALSEHPAIKSSEHGVEAAEYNVKTITGELLPTISLEASATRRWESSSSVQVADSASLVGRLTIPIYQQGVVSSRVRQAKQTRSQRRLEADATRDQVRAAVVSAWAGLDAARGQEIADQAQINAAELALSGVREEERVGQRTILDVLDAQQNVLSARVNLTSTQRNKVVAAYSLLSAMGRLTARSLGLSVREYSPEVHTEAIKDRWIGLRTPDGN